MDNVLEGRLQRGEISMAEIAEEEDNLNKTCLMHTPYIYGTYTLKSHLKNEKKVRIMEDGKTKKGKVLNFHQVKLKNVFPYESCS